MPWDDPVNDKVGNILLSRIMGADVRLDPAGFDIGIRDSWTDALDEVEAAGGTPYAIPAGASEHPLGGLGFANWAYEVAEQEKRARRLLRHDRRLHGHRLDPRRNDRRVRRPRGRRRCRAACIGIDASATLGADARPGGPDRAEHRRADRTRPRPARRRDHRPRGTGPATSTASRWSRPSRRSGWARSSRAMITDPVYEGKSMAGLIDLVSAGEIPSGLHRALRPPRRPARAQRLPPPLGLKPGAAG